MFSSTKTGHFTHIIATALLGQAVGNGLTPPDPTTIENYGHLIIQTLVAVVTIWATIRKALQRPETVVRVPAEVLPLMQVEAPKPEPDDSAQ
ncbi:hypothetical protein [Hymenobacter psychrophilus]|uniref:Uncharacterized protein n=1 Tax=Hymenobacter psychrophilus TaxID=651662 RepID=A0A1H3ISA3_9BACT|nr:hypothetical protein [Hymenobacter psychrophilus]SDY30129.1 hypothetical protein SAMN04488069_107121 [Hymenobacter psychrophilus]